MYRNTELPLAPFPGLVITHTGSPEHLWDNNHPLFWEGVVESVNVRTGSLKDCEDSFVLATIKKAVLSKEAAIDLVCVMMGDFWKPVEIGK